MFKNGLFYINLIIYLTLCISVINASDMNKINLTSFDTSLQNYIPLGRYAEFSDYNYGLTSQLNMSATDIPNFKMFFSMGLSNNIPAVSTINTIVDLYLVGGIGWEFNLDNALPFEGLTMTPIIGYGWMPHFTNGSYWSDGEVKTLVFQDQIFVTKFEFAYDFSKIKKQWDFTAFLTPSYVYFLEDEYDGQELGFNMGIRMPLNNNSKSEIKYSPKSNIQRLSAPVVVDAVSPVFIDSNEQYINNVTAVAATISFDSVMDDKTSADDLLYKLRIEEDYGELVLEKESKGSSSITVDNLSPDKNYRSFLSVTDGGGNVIDYNPVEFLTKTVIDRNSFNLGDNSIEVDLRQTLEVEFNNDINLETLTDESVYVESDGKRIKGDLVYKNRGLQFIPTEDFNQGKVHKFVISTKLKDMDSNSLANDVEFFFTALDYRYIFAHWKFDNNTVDSSGNNHTAELKSVKTDIKPEFFDIDDKGNAGLHFVGGYDWGTYIDLGTINMGDTFTITGWVNIDEPPEEYSEKIMTLISNGDAGAVKDGFKVFFNNWSKDDKRIVIETGNGSTYRNSETQDDFIAYGEWYNVAVVIDRTAGFVKLYFNGKEAATTNSGSILKDFNTNAPLHIAHFKDNYFHYNGYVDDFRIYNKTITASDIEVIARGRK